ncbi:SMI1/KNR4 family protein [Halogeometricum borinquense]|uniref:SMI1/KNR4 family protein n=1 Tax=Halogeometricum borinquense TaxID=60847 RepID=A0A482TDD7_9EURY|nr:SMI1/KNR4 family protein [Halogeometricum borinquense]RYJ14857.1 SMI1/KNR4 family protein [Halogeometricum borinquense]
MSENNTTVGEKAVELLVEHGYGPKEEIQGCTEEEIRELESEFNISLPEAYKSCMRHIGKHTNGFLRGSEFTYPYMKDLREYAVDMIERQDVEFEFEDTDFVFMGHQGYSFFYFNTQNGSNPPVYLFMSPDEPNKEADSFSEWLFDEIRS